MTQLQQQWKIVDLIAWGADYLARHDVPEPRLSTEFILSKTLQAKRLDLYLQFDRQLSADELAQIKILLKRRLAREPVQYLLGQWDFFGLTFCVNQHALIPRPETEILVESLLRVLRKNGIRNDSLGLDLGTGSGNIAITLLANLPESRCFAVDISLEALELARANAQTHGVDARAHFRQGSWFEALGSDKEKGAQFDWIVSNPPYVPADQWDALPREVREYEPRLALWGGSGGLEAYEIIVRDALQYLKPCGWLALEIGDGQREAIEALARSIGGWQAIEVVPDNNRVDRIVLLQREN